MVFTEQQEIIAVAITGYNESEIIDYMLVDDEGQSAMMHLLAGCVMQFSGCDVECEAHFDEPWLAARARRRVSGRNV
jgi:hypothetical protein